MRTRTEARESRRAARSAVSFKAEVRLWASKIGVEPKRVQIQRMKTKWASCSSAGRLCFSRHLLGEDASFQEIVIVHELLHLVVPNHGKLFKALMNAYLPGWEKAAGSKNSQVCEGDGG